FVDEDIGMMRLCLAEHVHYASKRRISPGAHVERLDREPGGIDADHFKTSRSHCAHSCAADRGHRTDTLMRPRRTSTAIGMPSSAALLGTGNDTKLAFVEALDG